METKAFWNESECILGATIIKDLVIRGKKG